MFYWIIALFVLGLLRYHGLTHEYIDELIFLVLFWIAIRVELIYDRVRAQPDERKTPTDSDK